ncbi:Cyanovirin-N [Dactylellina cionopaga]|nr:Cyanovirin-N [Dactylellina cionopaga]
MKASVIASAVFWLATVAQASGNFRSSCNNVDFRGTGVYATCRKNNGHEVGTSTDTNRFIGNDNGTLVKRGSEYTATCRNCYVVVGGGNAYNLNCECNSSNGWRWTSINLNDYIANRDGNLEWEDAKKEVQKETQKETQK